MDESYEQFEVDKQIFGDQARWLIDGLDVTVDILKNGELVTGELLVIRHLPARRTSSSPDLLLRVLSRSSGCLLSRMIASRHHHQLLLFRRRLTYCLQNLERDLRRWKSVYS